MAQNSVMSSVSSKSLKINMILNAVKGLMSVIFPLITFPYVSRVLGVDNLGSYNFANSIITYFSLIASLGIPVYAIREGARLRNDKDKLEQFADEMLTINITFTIVSYLLLTVFLVAVPKFVNYKVLIIILSLQIAFNTIGIEWIYSIYEDYAYITVRSIIFQAISLVLLFAFVRKNDDVNIYAAITVFSGVGSNVLNYIHARKYCRIEIIRKVNWKKHMKPIMILFAMSATVMIYVSSDTTILGFICSDYTVGIYSVSVKVYNIVKSIVASIVLVSIPRLSSILGKNDMKNFSLVASDVYSTLITVMFPAMIGMILLRREIVLFISGESFIEAIPSLCILCVAMIFCLGAYFWGQAILVPAKKEMIVFKATIVSAIVNIVLNFAFIPFWKENAAAFTTMIAEAIAYFWCRYEGKKIVKLNGIGKEFIKVTCGCFLIIIVSLCLMPFKNNIILYTLLTVICAVISYTVIETILKNAAILEIKCGIESKIKRKRI